MTDAHNHLHQLPDPAKALAEATNHGVTHMLVNGTSEADWANVEQLAQQHPEVLSSFGLHPWHVPERSANWLELLRHFLTKNPNATIGECGLDRWKKPYDLADQLQCLQAQLDLANELKRPLTIHCLQAWGPLLELLQKQACLPPFLLHAYSGSTELVSSFTKLGAYFSFNGYFLHERKAAVRKTFQHIPLDRLLLESDAPAMLPPTSHQAIPLPNKQNHPANLAQFIAPFSQILAVAPDKLATNLEENFQKWMAAPPQPAL